MSTVFTDSPVTPMSSLENSLFSTDAAKWEAVCRRDPAADGVFFYSVRTTGVYCRPSCGARLARLEHVTFFLTASHAERAGFRPCRRCLPHLPPRSEREASMVAEACRFIESSEEIPGLAEMSAHAGVSPHHFHRIFKRVTGVTPKSYAAAHRQAVVQNGLGRGVGITEAMYGAGFNSSARFYETAPEMFGMTPSAYRKGGEGEMVWHAEGRCSLGCVLVAATKRGVCAILLGDAAGALPDLEKVVAKERDYDFNRAPALLAQAYALTGEKEKAEALFRRVTVTSTLSETYLNFADFLASEGRNAEAREWAQKVLDKEPTMPRYLRRRERPWSRRAKKTLKRVAA